MPGSPPGRGRHPPSVNHPRTVVFRGKPWASPPVASRPIRRPPSRPQMVQNFIAGGAAVNQLCRVVDADLRVYEMNLDEPTADIVEAPAMSEQECARAIAYGMMAVEPSIDVLAIGEMGIANTTIAAALCLALYGGDAADWTGPGTGVSGSGLQNKRAVVAAAVARHKPKRARRVRPVMPARRPRIRRDDRCDPRGPDGAGAGRARRLFLPAPLPPYCTRSIRTRSITASPVTCLPSRRIAACSTGWQSRHCSISACGWAKPPARRSPCRS